MAEEFLRLHKLPVELAECEMWQNSQILSAAVAFTLPRPDVDRLCMLSLTPALAGMAKISTHAANILCMGFMYKAFMTLALRNEILECAYYKNRQQKSGYRQ